MSVRAAFEVAALVIVIALALMTTAILLAKGGRQLRDNRQATLIAEVRPRVLALLDVDSTVAADFRGQRRAVASAIALALLPSLRGGDREVLSQILGAGGALERAARQLTSPSARRRQRAAALLGAAGVTTAVDALVTLLHDRDAGVRAGAARALGLIGHPRAVVPLLATLDDRLVPANTVSMSLLRIGVAGAPNLMPGLESPSHRIRSVAAELAGSFGLTDAARRLELMLDDDDRQVRRSAARALARLGLLSSVASLLRVVERELVRSDTDRDEDLAVAAITALGYIGDRSAIPVLNRSLSISHRLSFAAAVALATFAPSPTPAASAYDGTGDAQIAPAIAILMGQGNRSAVA